MGGKPFPSDQCHSRLKDAEQDAAKVAYEILVTIDDDPTDLLGLIDQVFFFLTVPSCWCLSHFISCLNFVLWIVYRILNHVSSSFSLVVCLTINNTRHNSVCLSLPPFA